MAMAGTRKRNTQGAMMKSVSRVEYPLSSTFSSPGKTQTNSPLIIRKTTAEINPIRDEKKLFNSFIKIAYIIPKV
jgi:hypothetical protein